jgi:hypothetical protein
LIAGREGCHCPAAESFYQEVVTENLAAPDDGWLTTFDPDRHCHFILGEPRGIGSTCASCVPLAGEMDDGGIVERRSRSAAAEEAVEAAGCEQRTDSAGTGPAATGARLDSRAMAPAHPGGRRAW